MYSLLVFLCKGGILNSLKLDTAIVIKNGSKEFKTLYSLLLPYMTDTEVSTLGTDGTSQVRTVLVKSLA